MATGRRGVRRPSVVVCAVALGVLTLGAAPAVASHDDHGPGTIVLDADVTGPGDLVVVFPEDADEDAAIAEVERVADAAGIDLRDVDATVNDDPDTLRVRAQLDLVEHRGPLERRIPAERLAPWSDIDGAQQVLLETGRWVEGDALATDRVTPVDGSQAVAYRIAPTIVVVPLLLVLLGPFAYLALRLHARRVVAADGDVPARLHRVRRANVVVQLLGITAVFGVLFATGTLDGIAVGVEALLGRPLSGATAAVLGFAGNLVPVLALVFGATAAAIPADRELRETEQSTAGGAGDAARMLAVMLVPFGAWIALVAWAPGGDGWAAAVRLLIFVPAVLVGAPLLLNVAIRSRSLEAGGTRERIQARLDDRGLTVRDVRVMDSRGGKVANAAISGVIPQLRYVYVSDHLLDIVDDDELDAILEHEIAHGQRHHVLKRAMAAFGAIVVGMALVVGIAVWLLRGAGSGVLVATISIGVPLVMVVGLLVVQGGLSVRYELEADALAAEQVGADAMRRSLVRIAEANGLLHRTGRVWNLLQQHPGIEQRLERLGGPAITGADADEREVSADDRAGDVARE